MNIAPGQPGIAPRWTSSAKDGVGTALSARSRVWFTVSHGILNEVYYPRVDQACTRDFGLIVADGAGFFSEEKRDASHVTERFADGVPAFRVTNQCLRNRYTIEKDVVSDPERDVVLQRVRFRCPPQETHRVYALLSPHLVNGGAHNTGWLGDYKGEPMLFAEGDGTALALAASRPWRARSVGYAGESDGWQDINRHGRMAWKYDRAENGNIALTGELDFLDGDTIVLALAFGRNWSEAAFRARASLQAGFDTALDSYATLWRGWHLGLRPLDRAVPSRSAAHNLYRISASVLRAHEAHSFPGGIIASLSIPWGFSKGDDDLGGYHLVWTRDLVQTAGGLLACGALAEAKRVLDYLRTTQDADGSWPQNNWLDGTPYWSGNQMDECAFPILLVDMARREGGLRPAEVAQYWPMVELAAEFILCNGPATGQDRWEEDGGFSTYTLAVEVAALLVAADLADLQRETATAALLRESADAWNDAIDEWTWAADTDLSRKFGVGGYYIRIAPRQSTAEGSFVSGNIVIKNRPLDEANHPAASIVSPDALALVRFGLRDARDPRILDTIKVIDGLLQVDLPAGPCWRRYNGDGYGEHEDGRPFDGTGVGRAWPLLTAERAQYELAAGNAARAQDLLHTLETLVSAGGLLPEQVWDKSDIPERELFFGKPSGSAMPLVWAHAEHIKLRRSVVDERVFDTPPQVVQRYVVEGRRSPAWPWRPDARTMRMPAGRRLRLELQRATRVHWTVDDWTTVQDTDTTDRGLGLDIAELATQAAPAGSTVVFTLQDRQTHHWAGENYTVRII